MRATIFLTVWAGLLLSACGDREAAGTRDNERPEQSEPDTEVVRTHVVLTPEAVHEAGIEVSTAGPGRLSEVLVVYGNVAPNAERVRNVTARFPGIVRSVKKAAGESVRAGEVLATVESNDSLEAYPIAAPIAGVLTTRDINPGETVGDRTLFVIADLSTVWCELALFPQDFARVKVGQQVRVSSTDGSLTGQGQIASVSVLGDATNQSLKARVVLDNANRRWTPGLFVSASIVVSEIELPLTVSAEAVQMLGGKSMVFVAQDAEFDARPVQTGRTDGRIAEILSGLAAGEQYVSANSFVLKAEIEKGEEEDE
jgi:cobalt-zinc-cadmium efflux system membrane fusion protein